MPLTISGISGTMARTVTPIKYWTDKRESEHRCQKQSRKTAAEAACPDLRDVGLVQQGLNVLRDKIGRSRRQCGSNDEDDQRPPPRPVDHGSVVVRDCSDREQTRVATSTFQMLRVFGLCLVVNTCLVLRRHKCHKCESASSG